MLRELEASQRLEIEFQENWTPQALQQVVREHLESCPMLVVSNREPYIHNLRRRRRPSVQVPASGMVTAIEPIMRACSGTWIAHGSGTADRAVVDRNDHVRVPPDDPELHAASRVADAEEEEGYYYGFSNEGLWPLCHLAYVRPAFRERDWQQYVAVNAKFADVVAGEAGRADPVILIQDFHFALLPRLIRERGVKATIALFWHIPWPNAETFGVCPWKREMLLHMLQRGHPGLPHAVSLPELPGDGRSLHRVPDRPRAHDGDPPGPRLPGERLSDLDRVAAALAGAARAGAPSGAAGGAHALRHRPERRASALGVERWDFTKGIVERFLALEVLLRQHPRVARSTDASCRSRRPSRSKLPAYQALQQQTLARDGTHQRDASARDGWQPIVLIGEHQEPAQVFELYRAADFCLVNSLHDGMNLVAKEFVAARDDEDGVLILSTFAGASRELVEALLVNPYDVTETAAAIWRPWTCRARSGASACS